MPEDAKRTLPWLFASLVIAAAMCASYYHEHRAEVLVPAKWEAVQEDNQLPPCGPEQNVNLVAVNPDYNPSGYHIPKYRQPNPFSDIPKVCERK